MLEEKIRQQNTPIGMIKEYLIAGTIGVITLISPVQADADFSLPQPRYVQQEIQYRVVGEKTFEVPVLQDRWKEILGQKVGDLNGFGSDNCDDIEVNEGAIFCVDYFDKCVERKKEDNWGNSIMKKDIMDTPACLVSEKTRDVEFAVAYVDMDSIGTGSGFFGGDDVCFTDTEDAEKHCLDTPSDAIAIETANLLHQLSYISKSIKTSDEYPEPLKQRVERLNAETNAVWEKTSLYQKIIYWAAECALNSIEPYVYDKDTKLSAVSGVDVCIKQFSERKSLERYFDEIAKKYGVTLREPEFDSSHLEDITAGVLRAIAEEAKQWFERGGAHYDANKERRVFGVIRSVNDLNISAGD